MRINVTQAEGTAVVGIEGDLRLGCVADAKPELVAVLATGSDLRLDLGALGDCDTAGIQLLLMAGAAARAKGRRCVLIGHTDAFRAALDRVGIPVECFEFQAAARDDGQGSPDRA
jgi:anti-anti-sigma regulatory factor